MTNRELVNRLFNLYEIYNEKVNSGISRRDLSSLREVISNTKKEILKKITKSHGGIYLLFDELKSGNRKAVETVISYMDDFDRKKSEGYFKTISNDSQYPFNLTEEFWY